MEKRIYKDKAEVAAKFSHYFSELVANNPKLDIALSGGSTPKVIFDYLASNFKSLDWTKVHLYWGDERCVPPSDEQSNYKMTVDHLISKIDIPKENIHRIKGENDPVKEAMDYGKTIAQNVKSNNSVPQFDLVMLGMGSDGHTVSIFPHQIELWQSDKICEVATHPTSGQKRVTITGQVVNNAKNVAFLVTGSDKMERVSEIFDKEADRLNKYPAELVAPSDGELIWFLDQSAISR